LDGGCSKVPLEYRSDPKKLKEYIWNKDFLLQILRKEDKCRHSPELQSQYDEGWAKDGIPSTSIEEKMQANILSEFGIDPKIGLPIFWSYRSIYENDPDIREVALYIKYDRSGQGSLRTGDLMPNVKLSNLKGETIPLSLFAKKKPLVLIGGSYS